jgi:hypothetical protein
MIGKRFYPLKKCGKYDKGFIIGRDRKSLKQLEFMTEEINIEIEIIKSKDCPF